MRKSRKLISLLLAVVLTLSCFACLSSVSAFATEGDTLKGDVDKNGRVEITDVTLIQLYVAKDTGTVAKFENGTYDLAAADVDGNGTIDIMDATFTQLIIAHAEPTTAEPTTEAPTTTEPAEPTTEAPTTQEPTEAPTTEPATTTEPAGLLRKALSIRLRLFSSSAATPLTLYGTAWTAQTSTMTSCSTLTVP